MTVNNTKDTIFHSSSTCFSNIPIFGIINALLCKHKQFRVVLNYWVEICMVVLQD